MKVLSIRQPWAWLIVNGHKDVENRKWKTNFRGQVLIHASKQIDADGAIWVEETFPGLCKYPTQLERGGIVGTVEIVDCVDKMQSLWFFGPFGFVLKRAVPLNFFPMKGKLGFFESGLGKEDMLSLFR